jgi:outer membrane protein TolC
MMIPFRLIAAMSATVIALFCADHAFSAEALTWEECLQEAAERHPDLISASETLKQAEAQRKVVKGGLLPGVSAEIGGSRSGSGDLSPSGSWSYAVSARQLLYDGSKTSRLVDAAAENIKGSRYNADAVSSATRLSLRTAFVELLKAQQLVSLTREISDKRKQNLRLIALRYQAGREHKGSLSKAHADLAQADFEVTQAKRNLELAQLRLNTTLGRESFGPLRVSGDFSVTERAGSLPDFETIVRENPSYRVMVSRKDASRYSLDAARSAFMPEVSLSTAVGRSSFNQWPPDQVDWQVGVNVAVPIYEGGTGRATVEKARASLNQLTADEKSGYLSMMKSLQDSWKSFLDAVDNVTVSRKFLDAAVERARIADAQYSAGLVSFNEWIIIEDNLVSSKKSYLNARADMLLAEAKWIQAKGGTIEIR